MGNIVGAAMAAMAFTSVMAFEAGGIAPGVEQGDVVPARLTPGEAVIPKKLTEGLTRAAEGGGMGGGHHTTVHIHQTNHVNTIDGDGMRDTLEKHADELERHIGKSLRKMNY